MDIVTHLAIGACTAEVLLKNRLGKNGLAWGAVIQALPDIDTLPTLFLPTDQSLLIHRGLTHSFLFALITAGLLAFAVQKIYSRAGISFIALFGFFCFQLTLHNLIDTCNNYGTGLFEPFSHKRFSINLLYVADPLFSAGLIAGSLVLLFKRLTHPYRKKWAWGMIIISACYVCYAGINKAYINNRVDNSITLQKMQSSGYFTTPAPFNSMLWYIVVAADDGYYTGYSSVWDDMKQPISYNKHLKNYALMDKTGNKSALQNLIQFADGYYTISQKDRLLYLNVLRFGQVQGWNMPDAPFVFSYPLSGADNNPALLQKGRLAGWNKGSLKVYIKRIAGKTDTIQ